MSGARKLVVFCFDWNGVKRAFSGGTARRSPEKNWRAGLEKGHYTKKAPATKAGRRRKAALTIGERGLEGGEVSVEMSDGLDAAIVVFESEMFVGRVRVFVGKPEADEYTGHFERVVHLGDERDRPAFPNEYSLFAKAFLQGGLGHLENRSLVGCDPGL